MASFPDAVEAALIFAGVDLPERWMPGPGRDRSGPSARRLAVLVMNLPDGNVLAQTVHPEIKGWSAEMQVMDDMRRSLMAAWGVEDPEPHPWSPAAKKKAQADEVHFDHLQELEAKWAARNARKQGR